MLNLMLFLVFLLPATVAAQSSNACVLCHAALAQEAMAAPVPEWRGSVHQMAGIACQECHGGSAASMVKEISHDLEAGFKGELQPDQVHQVCGTCHQIQMTNYLVSPHGLAGDLWPSCIDCHGSHDIRQPLVAEISIPDNCEDCHENATLDQFVTAVNGILDPIAETRMAALELLPTGVPVDPILGKLDRIRNTYRDQASHVFLFDTLIPMADSFRDSLKNVEKELLLVREEVSTRRRFGWVLAMICVVLAGLLWLYRRSLPEGKG